MEGFAAEVAEVFSAEVPLAKAVVEVPAQESVPEVLGLAAEARCQQLLP